MRTTILKVNLNSNVPEELVHAHCVEETTNSIAHLTEALVYSKSHVGSAPDITLIKQEEQEEKSAIS